MRVFFDTEFIEDGRTIDLVSIGLVREDGAELYLESEEAQLGRASPWVVEHVLPHLKGPRVPRKEIAKEIVHFVGKEPEFWAYFADYDWVALCQLYGTMMALPPTWPMFCLDLMQLQRDLGLYGCRLKDVVPMNGTEHHALADARWNADAYDYLAKERRALRVGR